MPVQRAIIDSLYNARDVNPPEPCKTAMEAYFPDLLPSNKKFRNVGNKVYASKKPCRSRGYWSKSHSSDPEITNVTKDAQLLENISLITKKMHEPSTSFALLIAKYNGLCAMASTPRLLSARA